jgi:hypothetical protein
MAVARFLVRLPPHAEAFELEEIRTWLRRRFRENEVFEIASFPSRPSGEFGITVEFPGESELPGVIFAELREAVIEIIPDAILEWIDADFSEYARPVLHEPPSTLRENTTGRPLRRYVNTLITSADTGEQVPPDRPLLLAADYAVLVSIGDYAENSLLTTEDAWWPDGLLPERGLWLRAALTQDGHKEATVRPFYLPHSGRSFACDCHADGSHTADCAPRRWVRLALRRPAAPAIVHAELVIYYEAAAIHAQQLTLPVGMSTSGGPRAHLLGRLTHTFNDLGKLAGRSASIVTAQAPSRVVVNSVGFTSSAFAISACAGDTSARNAREALYSSHFQTRRRKPRSLYAADYAKAAADFQADLRRLAKEGAALYQRLFAPQGGDTGHAMTLPHALRHEAQTRGRPPVIQVVDGQHDEHAMLWSLIYDIPLGGDVARYELCESVLQFGPGTSADPELPALCPDGQDHLDRGDVLCPFGFWGLSCVIEQPPSVGRDLETVVLQAEEELSFIVAPDVSLDPQLTAQHLQRLGKCLPERSVSSPPIETEQDLMQALSPEAMDIVYFYCHSGYEHRSVKGTVSGYLSLGHYRVEPLDVAKWARTCWPYPHWPHRHPLVVLNGCHTAEATSGTLNSFVPAFTQWAAASGVVGTEVALEQGLAGWAMELLLAALGRGASVGDAVRDLRWAMLRRGNVMGFAYTPYCLANLALRQQ